MKANLHVLFLIIIARDAALVDFVSIDLERHLYEQYLTALYTMC